MFIVIIPYYLGNNGGKQVHMFSTDVVSFLNTFDLEMVESVGAVFMDKDS